MENRIAQKYMETNCPTTVADLKDVLANLKSNDLKEKIKIYFFKECEKNNYGKNGVNNTFYFLKQSLREINTPELEHDIEYLLTYFEDDFRALFGQLRSLLLKTNLRLIEICSCPLRYCDKKNLEEACTMLLSEDILDSYEKTYGSEVRQVFEDALDIEKNLIQEGYKKASQGETFCETCAPFCQVEQEKGKMKYKRTTPVR